MEYSVTVFGVKTTNGEIKLGAKDMDALAIWHPFIDRLPYHGLY